MSDSREGENDGGSRWVWALAVLVFAAVDLLMVPSLLDDRVRVPGEMLRHHEALRDGEPTSPLHNGMLSDWTAQFSWWQIAVRESWLRGEMPLWNARSGAGMPLAANLQSEALSPFLPLNLLAADQYPDWRQFAQLLVAQLLCLLLARRVGLGAGAGLVIGLSYSVVGYYLQVWAVHPLSASAAFAPGVLASFFALRATPALRHVLVGGVLLAASILAGHVETAFKVGLVSGMVSVFWWPRGTSGVTLLRYLVGVLGVGVLTFALTAALLLPFLELIEHSSLNDIRRGFSVIDHDPVHLATLIDENVLGSPVRGHEPYRGGFNYNEGSFFLGRTVLLLAGAGLLLARGLHRRIAWASFTTMALAALLIHGPLALPRLLAELPVFDAMVTTRLGFLMTLPAALLAGIGFEVLRRRSIGATASALARTLGAFMVLALLVAITSEQHDAISPSTPGLFLALGTALAMLLGTGSGRSAFVFRLALLGLLVVEGALAWRDYAPLTPAADLHPPAPAMRKLADVAGNERALISLGAPPAVAERFGIHRVRRYDPAVTKRLDLFFRRHGLRGAAPDQVMLHAPPAALDALSVRWLMTKNDPRFMPRPIWRRHLAPGVTLTVPVTEDVHFHLWRPGRGLEGGDLKIGRATRPQEEVVFAPDAKLPPGIEGVSHPGLDRFATFAHRGERSVFLRVGASTGGIRLKNAERAPAILVVQALEAGAYGAARLEASVSGMQINQRPTALPVVTQAASLLRVDGLDEALALWRRADFDPRRQTIIEAAELPENIDRRPAVSKVAHRRPSPQRLDIELGHDRGGMIVVAESWAPGWRAFTDEDELEVYPANVATFGVLVPPGVRKLRFVYRPRSFEVGGLVSLLALMAVGLLAIREGRKKRGAVPERTAPHS